MRLSLSSPRLASLVRSVLLEAHPPGADEAVIVGDSHLDTREPNRSWSEKEKLASDPAIAAWDQERERRREVGAKKSSAYMGTDRWREAVKRRYALLDEHPLVKDVVVKPIASAHGFDFKIRTQVVSHDEARRIVSASGGSLPAADSRSIIFIPIAGSYFPSPDDLPTPWVTVHAIFDDLELWATRMKLQRCSRLVNDIFPVLGSIGVDQFGGEDVPAASLLLNCGWSENAFHMVAAAAARRGAGGASLDRHLDDLRPPTIGKRYKAPSDAALRTSKPTSDTDVTGATYVKRPESDIAAEIMTIAVTKSEGLQPVLSRLPQIPDDAFRSIILANKHSFGGAKGAFSPEEMREAEQHSISPATRKKAERLTVAGLERIREMTSGALDLFVQDLLGKAILVLV